MSKNWKSTTERDKAALSVAAAKFTDLTLGSFAFIPTSAKLEHAVRFLSTWSGSDKLFMVLQYAAKLSVPFLLLSARLQHRMGRRGEVSSQFAESLSKISSIIGDSRMLWRFWGLLPIIQWLTSIERNPPPTRRLLNIERLQGWSMLAYYPLEHIYYLLSHKIIPSSFSLASLSLLFHGSKTRINLNANKIAVWSCRFWAAYVLLQFAHLAEDHKLLRMRDRALRKGPTSIHPSELSDLSKRWDGFWSEVIVNLGYLPLTVHWSLEQGLFGHDIWVSAFGLMAALASFRSGWKATELPENSADTSEPPIVPEKIPGVDIDDGGAVY